MTNPPVRTRIAPSPTGDFHIGHLSTTLRNLAFARKNSGQFIIRIEDTDRQRLVEGSIKNTLKTLHNYGLDWDEGPDIGGPHQPYVQSQRLDNYKKYAQKLIDQDKAYYCFCTKQRLDEMRKLQQVNKQLPKYDRACLKLSRSEITDNLSSNTDHVIRLKIPSNQPIAFNDLIRGEISINSNEIDDQVLLKSDGYPTYHLAVVVDDHLMKISHVIRGEEWISSTPKHILLYQAFGWQSPIYAHTPVFLNPSGKGKMSKRFGATSAQSFLDQGYLPQAVLNFLMIMGWAPKDKQEVLSLQDFFDQFTLENISPKSVVFDTDKLDWLNGLYIRKLDDQTLTKKLQPFLPKNFPVDKLAQILPLVKDRLVKLGDITDLTDFFVTDPDPDPSLLLKKSNPAEVTTQLQQTINSLESIDWTLDKIELTLRDLQAQNNWPKSQYFMALRVAVTGKTATPPLFETIHLVGQQPTITRLSHAHQKIHQN